MSGVLSDVAPAVGRPSAAGRVAELIRGIEPRTASSLLLHRLSKADVEDIAELLVGEGEPE